MQMTILAVGTRQPAWVNEAVADYGRRMPPDLALTVKEVKAESRTTGKSAAVMMAAEAQRLRAAMPAHARVVALDEHGQRLTSEGLAEQLSTWREQTDPVVFLIGGPDGLDASLKKEARLLLRLSDFTLPHGMARVLLAEQLYRAWSIGSGHPYHRA
ncbi:MAG TPA: 23S rRNA (pseudouridine(1915)-N(3))-methyltransferase RlmH [Burkholderiaceae bacterium]|nr:23S rRNA (pseudouridine(1915)-N(3))-methyltransferase RlmH [Burkholderiaceae bacterium]